ncbi:MAG: DUF1573 domain-containing protein [Brumimicrobium sp.]|nr:DUF1573 domain-containing protein [Brumimicrobium sp.]
MKIYFATIFIILNSAFGLCQTAEFNFKGKTTVKWDKTKEGELLSHYFIYQNTGSVPLIIEDAKVACPCTKVIFPKNPTLPGATDSILVTFDTAGKYYYQDRTIQLIANTGKSEKLRFKVYVIPKEEE